jgi:hypothetical protein
MAADPVSGPAIEAIRALADTVEPAPGAQDCDPAAVASTAPLDVPVMTAVIPDGTYRARFTADEFLAVGIGPQRSAEYMDTWTLVIDDGSFSFDLASDGPQYPPSTCDGSIDLVGGVVRFTFDGGAEDWCWAHDDVAWTADGGELTTIFIACGPNPSDDRGCVPAIDKAWFDRTWTRIE